MTDTTDFSSQYGSHVCHFYEERADLANVFVPYFRAGFEAHDAGFWITAEPLPADQAREALARACTDLAEREQKGQIEIVDYERLAGDDGRVDPRDTIQLCFERKQRALERGFSGLRIGSNTHLLPREDFDRLMAYEARIDELIRDERMVMLCGYCLRFCDGHTTLEALRRHNGALSRTTDGWRRLDSDQVERGRKALQRLRRRLQEEREAERALLEADRKKDEFLLRLGHELRNPLASILTTAQLIALRSGDKTFGKELEIIQRQVSNITSMVDDLVDVSLITAGRIKLDLEAVEIVEVVGQAVETVAPRLEQHDHRLHVESPPGLRVQGDLTRLVQVVTNLLTNAVRYTPSGGDISVRCQRMEDFVLLSVVDTGRGIDPGQLASIFEPFSRGAGTGHPAGLGIGLSIVRSLVELHGGTVEVASEPQRGSRFTVRLPAL